MPYANRYTFGALNSPSKEAVLAAFSDKLGKLDVLPQEFISECVNSGLSRFDILHLSIILKEKGLAKLADDCICANIRLHGVAPADLYELAVLRIVSDHNAGIQFLKQSITLSAERNSLRLALFISLFTDDKDLLSFVVSESPKDLFSTILAENDHFVRYLTVIPPCDTLVSGGIFQKYIQLDESVDWSVKVAAGGSLLRVGDGEGAMSVFSEKEELLLHGLYTGNRRHFSNRWVGNSDEVAGFTDSQARLLKGLSEFDIIGLPNPSWLMRCMSSADILGFSSAWNAIRAVTLHTTLTEKCAVRNSAFYDILYRGMLGDILPPNESVAVVSWNDLMPMALRQMGFAGDIRLLKVPPSASDIAAIFETGVSSITGREQLIRDLGRELLSGGVTTAILAGGHSVKAASVEWRKAGIRILDAGSALDVAMGLSIR